MSNKTTELKRGVYQLRAGKEVWVARNERSLKRKMKTPQAPYRAGVSKVNVLDGGKFVVYTSKNQKGRKIEVVDGAPHKARGYINGAKKKVGEGVTIVRAKIKCLKSS